MKKLILSAFAVSLLSLSPSSWSQIEGVDDFLGLETEILPELEGTQRFTTKGLHEKASWQVTPEKVVKDVSEPNKGQNFSIIPWSTLDPVEWVSIDNWLVERELKDRNPDWKLRLREAHHQELAAKFLQCKGTCTVFRGSHSAKTQYLSRVQEGDEVKTGKDSVAWLYFMDGSLLRLSPESSLSVHEFNIGKNEILILARLNQGHFYWHPRRKGELPVEYAPETDAYSLPLQLREANQEFFEREIFQSQSDLSRVGEVLNLDEMAIKAQTSKINGLRAEHGKETAHRTKFMIVSPNASIVASEVSFDFLYVPGGATYFKKRTIELGEEFSLHLRGYTSTDVKVISEMAWYEVEPNGRNYSMVLNVPSELQILELLTKRIKTIELAREQWFEKYSLPLLLASKTPEVLAREFGYGLWGEELQKRFNFLVEYTRRIETTNLRALENLLTKLENSGETVKRDLLSDQYQASLNHYLLGLKSRYDSKRMRVRELNDLQYYVWILKNGKF